MDTDGALSLHNEYSTLNLADLLVARELNHVELMRRSNVVGTAVGLYLVRNDDKGAPSGEKPPRTLENSRVVDRFSWPCILVFVDVWKPLRDLHWQDRLPDAVYLDEKRKAFEAVAGLVKLILDPPAGNVVPMARA